MRTATLFLLLPFVFICTLSKAQSCDTEKLIEACKKDLPPYSYNSSRSIMTKKAASREISVTLLSDEDYRLVFNISRLPEGSTVKLYDGPEKDSGRDLLMSSKDVPPDRERFLYEPRQTNSGTIYISYDIPDRDKVSCFTFVLGYRLSSLKN